LQVIKASCNVRNKKLHSYPYLYDSSEDEPYLSSDDNVTDHRGYVRSASRSSQKSASSEFARTTNSPLASRCSSTSPHISERKREQNRSAAIRYRDKRREEAKRKKQELHDLELKNVELKTQVAGLSKEISYLKTILHEVLDKTTN
uniref:BZIP domain-containing protein n=1 Tax=Anisakis simplex TaxID=6269 RepID=A0A0M3JD14_ANISI